LNGLFSVLSGYSGGNISQTTLWLATKLVLLRKVLLALAAHYGYYINQMDVATTFLSALLQEKIYITELEVFFCLAMKNKYVILLKSLYGLKQATRS